MVPSVDRIVSILKLFKNTASFNDNDYNVFTRMIAYIRNVNIKISSNSKASEKLIQSFELAEYHTQLFKSKIIF